MPRGPPGPRRRRPGAKGRAPRRQDERSTPRRHCARPPRRQQKTPLLRQERGGKASATGLEPATTGSTVRVLTQKTLVIQPVRLLLVHLLVQAGLPPPPPPTPRVPHF